MSTHHGEQGAVIRTPVELCFETIIDYESFPEWQDAVKRIDVVDRDEAGRGRLVDVVIDAKLREVSYRLHYHYEPPTRVWWEFVQGDGVEHVEGEYLLEPHDSGTRATYRLGIDPGVPVPGLVARRLNATVMKRSVQDLREEAERRAGR